MTQVFFLLSFCVSNAFLKEMNKKIFHVFVFYLNFVPFEIYTSKMLDFGFVLFQYKKKKKIEMRFVFGLLIGHFSSFFLLSFQFRFVNKRNFWNAGSFEEHEIFSEVLIGIKNVISSHLRDVQLKFEDHFQSLDFEIRQRDVMIDQLQHRILELENGHVSPSNVIIAATSGTGNGSTGSSGDIPFVVCEHYM